MPIPLAIASFMQHAAKEFDESFAAELSCNMSPEPRLRTYKVL